MKPLGALPVKGFAYAVDVYELTRAGAARSHLQTAPAAGLTRFRARAVEFDWIRRARELAGAGPVVGYHRPAQRGQYSTWSTSSFIRDQLAGSASSNPVRRLTRHYDTVPPNEPNCLRHPFKLNVHDGVQWTPPRICQGKSSPSIHRSRGDPAVLDLLNALDDDDQFQCALRPVRASAADLSASIRLLVASRLQPVVAVFEDMPSFNSLSIGLLTFSSLGPGCASPCCVVGSHPVTRR